MRTFFHKNECSHCNCAYDSIEDVCPNCGTKNPAFARGYAFEHHLRDAIPWQIGYFLIGWAGFQALGLFLQIAIQIVYSATHSGATKEELAAFMNQVGVSFSITGGAYALLFIGFALILILRKKLPLLAKSFRNWLPYVVGICGGALILGVSIAYSLLADAIMKAANIVPSVNENESAIRAMTQAFPVLSVFIFGFLGPFCEEITYRVGLFGFTSRLGKVLAYVISALVFASIHFGWNVLIDGTRDDVLIEIINFPSYLIAGVGLTLLYDRFGLCASFLAHATNNLVSVLTQIASGGKA